MVRTESQNHFLPRLGGGGVLPSVVRFLAPSLGAASTFGVGADLALALLFAVALDFALGSFDPEETSLGGGSEIMVLQTTVK